MHKSDYILIVEDDPIIAKDIQSLLRSEGFEYISIAHDGLYAQDILASQAVGFVILDIYLGTGISGIEVASTIQKNYDIPFIFLTSFSDKETLEAAKDQVPYGYLVKPFQDRTLLTTIEVAWSNFEREKQLKQTNFNQKISHLTSQEQKLIAALIEGKSSKEIASTLFISVNTVKYHLKNIYQKMEVSSRSELLTKLL